MRLKKVISTFAAIITIKLIVMKKSYLFTALSLFCSLVLLFISCEKDVAKVEPNTVGTYNTPKYIFYFIGDGMSSPQINVTEAALNSSEFKLRSTQNVGIGKLNLRKFPVTGMQTTHAEDRYITGSAASGTALATGYKTTIGTIGMNGEHTEKYETMAEIAKRKGMKVGIVSSVSIDHATPACFYAHTGSRNNYYTIGQHLTQSGFDYFAGGGVRWNKYDSDKETKGLAEDINLFLDAASAKGYKYVNTKSAFNALTAADGKVIATLEQFKTNVSASAAAMPYTVDLDEQISENDKITLSDFTKKGIELLNNDDKGFFLMVEGGKIDWACHANDVVSAAHNTVEFDKAIGFAIDFYEKHKDETLIVVTGDHECGGLTLGFAATGYNSAFDKLNHQTVSYESFTRTVRGWKVAGNKSFESALADAQNAFGLGDESKGLGLSKYEKGLLKNAFDRSMTGKSAHHDAEIAVIYGYYDPFTVTITHILNNRAGIDWTSYSHTGTPVPVFALGQGMYEFSGYYDNTDVAKKIMKIAALK